MSPVKPLPIAGPEPAQNRDLSSLEDDAAMLLTAFILESARVGIPLMVVEARRLFERQAWLYSIGRTHRHPTERPMAIRTKAAPGHSNHEKGRAADLVPVLRVRNEASGVWTTIADWNSPHWPALAKIAKRMGLIWGGDFPELHDNPHFEAPAVSRPAATPQTHTAAAPPEPRIP